MVPVDVGAGPVALDGHTDVAVDVVPGGAEEAPQAGCPGRLVGG